MATFLIKNIGQDSKKYVGRLSYSFVLVTINLELGLHRLTPWYLGGRDEGED